MQVPQSADTLVDLMSVPPSASVTVPTTVNAWSVPESVKVPTDAPVGALLVITSADELVAFVDAVHVVAVAVSSHTMELLCTKLPEERVLAVWPAITAPFLNHFHVRALVFSVSPSGSDQAQVTLQVRVEVM